MKRRIYTAFGVAILLAFVCLVDILMFASAGQAPVHPALAMFGSVCSVGLAFVASVAWENSRRVG